MLCYDMTWSNNITKPTWHEDLKLMNDSKCNQVQRSKTQKKTTDQCFQESVWPTLKGTTMGFKTGWGFSEKKYRKRMHGKHKDMCELGDKGSVASVTRYRRPRADSSHGLSLINALSSFPLSEPSLKELHTSRAPLGLSHRPTETT